MENKKLQDTEDNLRLAAVLLNRADKELREIETDPNGGHKQRYNDTLKMIRRILLESYLEWDWRV